MALIECGDTRDDSLPLEGEGPVRVWGTVARNCLRLTDWSSRLHLSIHHHHHHHNHHNYKHNHHQGPIKYFLSGTKKILNNIVCESA